MRSKLIISLAAAGVLALPLSACSSFYDIILTAPPKLFIDRHAIAPKHDIPVFKLTMHLETKHTIVKFSATATLVKYEYVRQGGKRVLEAHTIAAWHRGLTDLPPPGDSLTWIFPNPRKPHHEQPVKCLPGQYYSRIRVDMTGTNGVPLHYTLFYPYDITRTAFQHAPSPHRSWQVDCKRYGRVPDPAGEDLAQWLARQG